APRQREVLNARLAGQAIAQQRLRQRARSLRREVAQPAAGGKAGFLAGEVEPRKLRARIAQILSNALPIAPIGEVQLQIVLQFEARERLWPITTSRKRHRRLQRSQSRRLRAAPA